MSHKFRIVVQKFTILREIPGSWTAADFAALLDEMEYGDTNGLSDDELRELCVLSLQDLEPTDAAALLLKHRLGDALSKGQIENLSHEAFEEKLWEEYADMPLHERLFHVGSLLYCAFPKLVDTPDAVEVVLEVAAEDEDARRVLGRPLHESFLARLLADGMPESAPLHRLFGESVAGAPFPEAESLVWIFHAEASAEHTVSLKVTGSGYWLDSLRETESYRSGAKPDA